MFTVYKKMTSGHVNRNVPTRNDASDVTVCCLPEGRLLSICDSSMQTDMLTPS